MTKRISDSDEAKRPRGEGSIYERKDGRWVAAMRDPVTGKRRYGYAPTQAGAYAKLRKMTGRSDRGEPMLDARAKFRQYADAWLEQRAGKRRRASTVGAYEQRLNAYVYPTLGGFQIASITSVDIEDMYDDLLRRGLSLETIKGARNALSAVLTHAVKAKHIVTNEVTNAELPDTARRTKKVTPPTAEQVGALLDKAAETGEKDAKGELYPLLVVLATTGVRIGEALGSKWADIDLDSGIWEVSRTTTRDKAGRHTVGQRTKTGDTRRLVLAPDTITALKAQRKRVAAARLKRSYWDDNDLVFPSAVGTVWDINNVRRKFVPIATAAGFPGTFHSLRHFNATVALSSVPLSVVSKTLGHRRASTTTDIYQHLLESDAGSASLAVSLAVKAARDASAVERLRRSNGVNSGASRARTDDLTD
jgi:integrase